MTLDAFAVALHVGAARLGPAGATGHETGPAREQGDEKTPARRTKIPGGHGRQRDQAEEAAAASSIRVSPSSAAARALSHRA